MKTLAQLLNAPDIVAARQFVIDVFVSVGFKSAPNWQDGGLARTCGIEVPAAMLVDVATTIGNVARGLLNDTSEGDWLTLYAASAYDNYRKPAAAARGMATLTAGVIGHNISADYLVASDATGKYTFRNKTGGTLSPGGTMELEWEAEVPGAAHNRVDIGQLTKLKTSLGGVTINNPGVNGVWLTRLGTDEEGDEALRVRNKTKWATRAMHAPEDAYKNWALEAAPEITRAEVDGQNPMGYGTLVIYIAGADGALPESLESVVVDYIYGTTDGIVRRGLGALPLCEAATGKDIAITGTIYQSAAYAHSVKSTVEANLKRFASNHPIGGVKLDPNEPGKLLRASLYGEIMKVPGVMNADIQSPAPTLDNPTGDVEMLLSDVAQFNINLNYITV